MVGAEERGIGSVPMLKFEQLTYRWKEDTLLSSDPMDAVNHPAYQQIIQMGEAALPLIFEEMRREPHHWFSALRSITGENPIPDEDRGRVHRMTDSWLRWAATRNM